MVTTPAFTIPLKNSSVYRQRRYNAENPIYHDLTGRPPDEPSTLGEVLRCFAPLFTKQFLKLSTFGYRRACSYRIAVVSIKKSYPGHARRITLAVWSYKHSLH